MKEYKIEHLKMIEDIITRMAQNSFQLKSWAVSLISALIIFADFKQEKCFIWIALIPIFIFWGLDAFYLWLERKYRKLYSNVQQDFVNNTDKVPCFDMNTKDIQVEHWLQVFISKSIWPIYVAIIGVTFFVLIINHCVN